MGCGICRAQLNPEEPVAAPQAQIVTRPADILSQENLDTLTKAGEREVVIQSRLRPEDESLPSEEQKPIDSYGETHIENFGNAREDTEVVLDAPAIVRKKPETPEGLRVALLRPLKPLIPDVVGQPAPKSALKSSEKPLFELPKIAKSAGNVLPAIIRLPSDLLLIETTKSELPKAPPKVSSKDSSKEETLDQLLKDIEAM